MEERDFAEVSETVVQFMRQVSRGEVKRLPSMSSDRLATYWAHVQLCLPTFVGSLVTLKCSLFHKAMKHGGVFCCLPEGWDYRAEKDFLFKAEWTGEEIRVQTSTSTLQGDVISLLRKQEFTLPFSRVAVESVCRAYHTLLVSQSTLLGLSFALRPFVLA